MKKSFILLFAALMATAAGARIDDVEINETNFPDDIFRYFLLMQDYGHDGILTRHEISYIDRLDVKNLGISNLQGIEYFTWLYYLDCSYNNLTTIDVSKNDELETLVCNNNKLTTLDLSNTRLEFLMCSNNQIRGAKMDALIASLPKNNTSQERIFFVYDNSSSEGNVITTTQVMAAKARGWTPYCYDDGWTPYEGRVGLDINYENFPDGKFREFLYAQDYGKDGKLTDEEIDGISSLDVKNLGISNLKGLEYFTHLAYLDCSGNNLTTLDVSENVHLQQLFCYNNKLTVLDVSENVYLQQLFCYNNELTALDVSNNTELWLLSCTDNKISALDVSNNKKLQRLLCYGNKITALDVSKNTSLIMLNCGKNQIKDAKMDALIASLPKNNTSQERKFYVYENSQGEGNVITKAQVESAKARGWTPYWDDGGGKWTPYDGIDPFPKGDVNHDGTVDVADIATVIDVMAGKSPEYKSNADVNGDKSIDVADIASIIDIMAGK